MPRHHRDRSPRRWWEFRNSGILSERQIQLAIGLQLRSDALVDVHKKAADGKGLLLLEWLVDPYRLCLTAPERAPDIRKLMRSKVNDLNDLGTNHSNGRRCGDFTPTCRRPRVNLGVLSPNEPRAL